MAVTVVLTQILVAAEDGRAELSTGWPVLFFEWL